MAVFTSYGVSSTNASSSTNNSNYGSSQTHNDTNKQENEPKLDSRQQYKTNPVSSEDYRRVKWVDLYYRDGDKAKRMNIRAELYKKGGFMYVKIGDKFYPRTSSNWQRFRNAIVYGDKQLYYDD